MIEETKISVSYDRFTTRFEMKNENGIIYSSLVLLWPIRNADILINNQKFIVKIFWFILWQSKLLKANKVIVKELLYHRRKKSIGLFIYFLLASSVKIGIELMA